MKKYTYLMVLLTVWNLCISGCIFLPAEEEAKIISTVNNAEASYNETPVLRGDLEDRVSLTASYVPFNSEILEIHDPSLPFIEINVQTGDYVEAGEILARQDCTFYDEKIQACENDIKYAQMKLTQLKNMRWLQVSQQNELLTVVSEAEAGKMATADDIWNSFEEAIRHQQDMIDVRQMELSEWQAKRDMRQLVATISGTVTYAAKLDEKGYLNSGATKQVFTISDSTSSYFKVKTEYADHFHEGDHYNIKTGKKNLEAVVVKPEVQETDYEDTTVYFALTQPDTELKKNDRGSLILVLDSRKDALYVRSKAVVSSDNGYFVYYQDETGMLNTKPVEIGLETDHYIQIISGVEEGEMVIIK